MLVRLICIFITIATLIGCGRFENQWTTVVSSDEVVVTHVFCATLIAIPILCFIEENRTVYVHVEEIVTEIVDIIVVEEVEKEVIIEKIVLEIETKYITAEVDITVVVNEVKEKVKQLVPENELIDVPLDEIIEEVTNDYIQKLEEGDL